MSRGVLAGAVGVLQGLVAVLLVVTLGRGPDDVGLFAYTPLQAGTGFVVPGPPVVRQEWLLVPLVLGALGALSVAVARRVASPAPGRPVVAVGVAGPVVGVVTVALDPEVSMPRRYADYLPVGPTVSPVLLVVVGSVVGAAVLVALTGLAEGQRWGLGGHGGGDGPGGRRRGGAATGHGAGDRTLLSEVLALVLGAAAVVLARRV